MRGATNIAGGVLAVGLAMGVSGAWAQPASNLTDKERQQQCDRDLCAIVNAPKAEAGDLKCELSETWYKEEIATAVEKGRLSWPFGDARCSGSLDISRSLLAPAITEASFTLKVPPQPVRCEVDTEGGRHELKANMAPEIDFKDGKATTVSLGIQDIEGNAVVRNVVWAAWKFESTFGFFHEDFVKGVNDYIADHCPTLK